MKTDEDAKRLAEAMVRIGNNVGRNTMAVISDMSQPLGRLLVTHLKYKKQLIHYKVKGSKDLEELCLTLGSQMVYLAGQASSLEDAREKLIEVMNNGKALESFKTFLSAQGGDASVVDDPSKLPQAQFKVEVEAKEDGYVSEIVADEIGTAAMLLGAGRATKESEIDLAVGLMLRKK